MIEDISIDETSHHFCWRDNWVNPCESIWSLLHKFAFLNAADFTIIKNYFCSTKTANSDNLRYKKRGDLRFASGMDSKKLMTALRISTDSINRSTVEFYVKYEEVEILSSPVLRFCVLCLNKGFHSPIHQLLVFERCPLHNTFLQNSCLNCGSDIPYTLTSKAFKHPYSCSVCCVSLSSALSFENRTTKKSKLQLGVLDKVARWLRKRINIASTDLRKINIRETNDFFLKNRKSFFDFSGLLTYWSDAVSVNNADLENVLKRERNSRYIHNKLIFPSKKQKTETAFSDDQDLFHSIWNKKKLKIYKSIKRELIETQLKNHLECFYNVYSLKRYVLNAMQNYCCNAAAYFIWRTHFEDEWTNYKFYFKSDLKNKVTTFIKWDPPNFKLSLEFLEKIFALECYWSYYECKLLAIIIQKSRLHPLHKLSLTGQFLPYWMITESQENGINSVELHWWVDEAALIEMLSEMPH